jgi:hypothetical protein
MVAPLPLISPVVFLLSDGLMEEELPSFNSNTTGDINGRGTTIV